jgi:MFS family permease
MMVFPSSAVYSVTTPISKATELKVSDLVSGTGAMFLFYGWGCIVWQAFALQYGKRPAYLISIAASIIIMAVTPLCTTNGPYLATKILQVPPFLCHLLPTRDINHETGLLWRSS